MCYQLVELYSACRCLYYQHAVDRCASYGRHDHGIQQKVIYVGYACTAHSSRSVHQASSYSYSDSGYHSTYSSNTTRRWNVLSSVVGCQSWPVSRFVPFNFEDWISHLYSSNPSNLSSLLVAFGRQSGNSSLSDMIHVATPESDLFPSLSYFDPPWRLLGYSQITFFFSFAFMALPKTRIIHETHELSNFRTFIETIIYNMCRNYYDVHERHNTATWLINCYGLRGHAIIAIPPLTTLSILPTTRFSYFHQLAGLTVFPPLHRNSSPIFFGPLLDCSTFPLLIFPHHSSYQLKNINFTTLFFFFLFLLFFLISYN